MTIIRFNTASEVFDTFPFLGREIEPPADNSDPLTYLRVLSASKTPEDAISFLSFMLPRRHAVYWGCGCVRALLGSFQELDQDPAMQSALAWLRRPEELERARALTVGMEAEKKLPSAWLALAAGWTGGSMLVGPRAPLVSPSRDLTGRCVCTAVLLSLAQVHHSQRDIEINRCVEHGIKLAQTDPT